MTDQEQAEAWHYRAFGLRVKSSIELPELLQSEGDCEPDIHVERGEIPQDSGPDGLVAIGDALVLSVAQVGRYRIEGGSRIIVDAPFDVPERNVRLFLLGSAFGALLHQRGLLPLHANAVEIGDRAIAFMGESGVGKSTLAAWFHDRGHRIVADDVCVVQFPPGGSPLVAPGTQRLRLWKEALERSGRDSANFARSFDGRDDIEKFDVPFDEARRGQGARILAAIYVLGAAAEFAIEPLAGVRAAEAVFSHTYRGRFVNAAGLQQVHWQAAVRLVQCVPIFAIRRPRDLSLLDVQGDRIITHVNGIPATAN